MIRLKNPLTPSGLARPGFGGGGGQSVEAQVRAAQQLPLDLFARLQVQGGRQRDGDVDEEARSLSLGPNDLDAEDVLRGDGFCC